MRSALALGLITTLLYGCSDPEPAASEASPSAAPQLGKWGVELAHINPEIRPGDDFYRYVNDGWLEKAVIPAGYSALTSFVEVNQRTQEQLQALLDGLDTHSDEPGPAQQVAAFNASYLNYTQRNAAGITALTPQLDAIAQAESRADLVTLMGQPGYPSVFDAGVILDFGNPERNIGVIVQGGLLLPGREHYLGPDYAALRTDYLAYIRASLARANLDASQAEAVLAFETALAETHWTPAQSRDITAAYHPMTPAALADYAPGYDWPVFFDSSQLDGPGEVIVMSDSAVQAGAALFANSDLPTLKAYMQFHLLNSYAPYLSAEWENAHFDFFSRKVNGIAKQKSVRDRALDAVNTWQGEQLGRLYSAQYFPETSKEQIAKMVEYLLAAYRERLASLAWMDDATRAQALEKLDNFTVEIGYPDRWHDTDGIVITPDDLIANVRNITQWRHDDGIRKLSEPPRRWEWEMSPQDINAYYRPELNEIAFPAGILQAPFFDPNADAAVNFGAIGVVIGHEIGHGFDDQGSRSDAHGKLRNWWSDDSRQAFEALTAKLVAQYNRFEPFEGLHVNGQLTLGENIGDLGGTEVALAALEKYLAEHPDLAEEKDGYTPQQRFFLGQAQLWRARFSEEMLRNVVLTNPHSPNEYRVNGVVPNIDGWYDAFGISSDDALYRQPAERISIW